MPKKYDQVLRLAGFELNALRASGVLGDEFERTRISAGSTPVYDIHGTLLFHRLPLRGGRVGAGFADLAVHGVFGEPLLGVSHGAAWDEKALLKEGVARARRLLRRQKYDTVRFVAYSLPKLALQFLLGGEEVLLLELFTWLPVPPRDGPLEKAKDPNFTRWSPLDELPAATQRARARAYTKRVALWDGLDVGRLDLSLIRREALAARADFVFQLHETRELHYSTRNTDHVPCYELRGQQTNVWCVAASAEMLLNFYRYAYSQVRLADELGLGTLAAPNGLPYARVGDVVTVLEDLTSDALDVTMHTNPAWSVFRNAIIANRPLISFVPGHSRTVAGYTRSMIALVFQVPFRGLLVYDPWPPTSGVITRWENFNTQTYQYAYTATLRHV